MVFGRGWSKVSKPFTINMSTAKIAIHNDVIIKKRNKMVTPTGIEPMPTP